MSYRLIVVIFRGTVMVVCVFVQYTATIVGHRSVIEELPVIVFYCLLYLLQCRRGCSSALVRKHLRIPLPKTQNKFRNISQTNVLFFSLVNNCCEKIDRWKAESPVS